MTHVCTLSDNSLYTPFLTKWYQCGNCWATFIHRMQGSDTAGSMSSYRLAKAFAPEFQQELGHVHHIYFRREAQRTLSRGGMSTESCTDFALADPCYIKEAQACPEHPLPIAKLCRYRCKSLGRALVPRTFVKWFA